VLGIPAKADVDIVTIVELVPTVEVDRTAVVLSGIQKKNKAHCLLKNVWYIIQKK
jgi:hypothetical protein